MGILDQTSSDQLLESLRDLRLRHFGEVMTQDLLGMTPSEQGLVLKHLCKWAQTERAQRQVQLIANLSDARQKAIFTNFLAHCKTNF